MRNLRMTLTIFRCQVEDFLSDAFRVVDIFELEPHMFGRGLYGHIAVVENGVQDALHFCGGVLDLGKMHLGRDTMKEAMLFCIDDAFIGHNPRIQVVIRVFQKDQKPHAERIGTYENRKRGSEQGCFKPHGDGFPKKHGRNDWYDHEEGKSENDFQYGEPMAA